MQAWKSTSWVLIISTAIFIKIFSFFPDAVEQYYSNGLYPYIGSVQRILLGWVPFSIGDLFYLFIAVTGLLKLARFVVGFLRKKPVKRSWSGVVAKFVFILLVTYISFNLLWGLNYNRPPMEEQMGLTLGTYTTENLLEILGELKTNLDAIDSSARLYRTDLYRKRTLFQEAVETYNGVSHELPGLTYRYASVKPSLYSYIGNYLGFTGYYNPFSGEAQTNTTVPVFVQPFTTCHEIGHQLGYAKENEANFAGFLAARSSFNPAFKYSVYFDMYSYTIKEMYRRDSVRAKALVSKLKPDVKNDFKTITAFYKKYESPLEPVFRKLYGKYLKANEQPDGLKSYNQVVAMLIGYRKKFGHL